MSRLRSGVRQPESEGTSQEKVPERHEVQRTGRQRKAPTVLKGGSTPAHNGVATRERKEVLQTKDGKRETKECPRAKMATTPGRSERGSMGFRTGLPIGKVKSARLLVTY